MSKQRVHELAKEFGKTNKDVMDFLKSKNIDVKSHMSTVEDKDAEMVRANFRKGNVTAAAMPESEEKPKKKLIQVFRPQNASHKPEKKDMNSQDRQEIREEIQAITVRETIETMRTVREIQEIVQTAIITERTEEKTVRADTEIMIIVKAE